MHYTVRNRHSKPLYRCIRSFFIILLPLSARHSPLSLLYMFISSNHLDCECTHLTRKKIPLKRRRKLQTILHLTRKRRLTVDKIEKREILQQRLTQIKASVKAQSDSRKRRRKTHGAIKLQVQFSRRFS